MQFTELSFHGKERALGSAGEVGRGDRSAPVFTGRPICVPAWREVPISRATAPHKFTMKSQTGISLLGSSGPGFSFIRVI